VEVTEFIAYYYYYYTYLTSTLLLYIYYLVLPYQLFPPKTLLLGISLPASLIQMLGGRVMFTNATGAFLICKRLSVFQHVESSGGQCVGCRFRGEESLAHYSPWSCGTIGHCLSPFEPEMLAHTSTHSCSEHSVRLLPHPPVGADTHLKTLFFFSFQYLCSRVGVCSNGVLCFYVMQELDSNGGGGGGGVSGSGNGVGKRWLHSLDHYRRLKDEDPIIPFSEGPIISKWGAISRASRTGYHTTDPIQATACQGNANTTPINFKGEEGYRVLTVMENLEKSWNFENGDCP